MGAQCCTGANDPMAGRRTAESNGYGAVGESSPAANGTAGISAAAAGKSKSPQDQQQQQPSSGLHAIGTGKPVSRTPVHVSEAIRKTWAEDEAKLREHGYWDNGLGVPSSSPLWFYDQKDKYKDWDWAACIGREFTEAEQLMNARRLQVLMEEIKPSADSQDDPLMSGITFDKPKKLKLYNTILEMFGLAETQEQVDAQLEIQRKLDEFVQLCRAENLGLPPREIYRASTNAWPMFTLQYLRNRHMANTPSVVGFSLLYPLTDDIYDNQGMSREEREDFGVRLRARLSGEVNTPTKNKREEEIWRMISYVEKDCDRSRFPHPFAAMNGLNTAQIESMDQVVTPEQEARGEVNDARLWERITRKGAGSILSDAAIVFCDLSPEMASFSALFGSITQWLNDIKAIDDDYKERQFCPYVSEWFYHKRPLDQLQASVFCYVHDVFTRPMHMKLFEQDELRCGFMSMMRAFLMMKMLEGVAINTDKHSKEFLAKCERRSPVHLMVLAQIRKHFVEKIGA